MPFTMPRGHTDFFGIEPTKSDARSVESFRAMLDPESRTNRGGATKLAQGWLESLQAACTLLAGVL